MEQQSMPAHGQELTVLSVPELTLDAPDHTNFNENKEAVVNTIKF